MSLATGTEADRLSNAGSGAGDSAEKGITSHTHTSARTGPILGCGK